MNRFLLPTEVISGAGCLLELKRFVKEGDRVALVTDESLVKLGLVKRVEDVLVGLGASFEVFAEVPANPHAEVVNKCRAFVEGMKASVVVCLGGGSPMDVAKVVAMLATNEGSWEDYQWNMKQPSNAPLSYVAIPTTSGTGSEVTKTSVIIDRNSKKGTGGDFFFARAALLDPTLMVSLPPHLTSTTGVDALTHAIEAYVGRNHQAFTDALALESISILAEYLPRSFADGSDLVAREKVAIAAAMAGLAMDQSGLGVVHALSGPLSSYYDVPHGLSNAVGLPYGMAYNLIAVPERYARVAEALGVDTSSMSFREAAEASVVVVEELLDDLQVPTDLNEYFVKYGGNDDDISKFAREACGMFLMRNNPRVPQVGDIEGIFEAMLK